jgi:hypothetical protein
LGCVISLNAPTRIRIWNKQFVEKNNELKGDGNYSTELLFTNACPLAILKLNACHSSNLFERLDHLNEFESDNDNKFEKEIKSDIDSQ